MSPPRRRRPGTYRPPRDRREVLVAVLCAVGVVVVTVALLFVLRPRDEGPPATPKIGDTGPPNSIPLDSIPTDSIPTDSVPAETTASTAAPAP